MSLRAEPVTASTLPWGTVTLLAMGAFASSGMMRTLDPMLPRLGLEFGIPIGHAAWAITAFAIAYGVLQIFFGPLGDRLGKLRVIAWAGAFASLASIGCALAAGSFTWLVAARALAGACCAATIPLSMAWIGDAVPYDLRQPVLARFMIGQMMGMAFGQVLGGFAAEQPYWQWPFLFFAAVFALAAGLLLKTYSKRAAAIATTAPAMGHMGEALLDVLGRPWARLILYVTLAEGTFFLGSFAFIATHLHHVGGLSLKMAGAILMAFSVGGVVFALLARRGVAALGELRTALIGGALTVVSLALLALISTPALAVLATFASGVGFYMLHNTLQTHATQMAPERRGAAVALFATCFFVGQSIGVSMFGAIGDRWGTQVLLLVGACTMVPVVAVLACGLGRRARRAVGVVA